jgi:hypothetical protein
MFKVTLKPGHPTGTYRRGGYFFHASEPTILESLPDAVADDPQLIITKISEAEVQALREGNKPSGQDAGPLLAFLHANDVDEALAALRAHEEQDEKAEKLIDDLKRDVYDRDLKIQDLEQQLAEATKGKKKKDE